jgi:type II secretory pathway predicted ATPase ExeA
MYDTYFGFTDKPFQLNPDPRFFFNSSTHKRALSYLRYGIAQGEGFIVITGDVGTGKTTLVRTLFQSLDGARVVAGKIANTMLQPDDLLRLVAAEFGLPYESVSKAEILRNMEVFFRTCVQEKRRVLLVVDEAQNLPPAAVEELRMFLISSGMASLCCRLSFSDKENFATRCDRRASSSFGSV